MQSCAGARLRGLMHGDAAVVAGYMGSGTAFDEAIGEFAMTYADQTDRDWKTFLTAIDAGRIVAEEP
jgi:hypothetical protein